MTTEAHTALNDAIVVDLLAPGAPGLFVTPNEAAFDAYVSCYERAGVAWASFTVALDLDRTIDEAVKRIARSRRYFLQRPERFILIESMADVRRARMEKKLAVNFNFQGTNPIAGDLNMLEVYRRLGVHHMLMAYNLKNAVGDGCHERTDGGLSRFGIRLVQEMNRVGIVVDVSHTGYQTTMEVCEVSTRPVIFSHSGCRELYDHGRNIRDDQIRACAKSGGVIGVVGLGLFMSQAGRDVSAQAIVRHIEHVADRAGPQHVGLGLDYIQNTSAMIEAMQVNSTTFSDNKNTYNVTELYSASPEVIPEIADALLKKGYAEETVRGILGENWVRVFELAIG